MARHPMTLLRAKFGALSNERGNGEDIQSGFARATNDRKQAAKSAMAAVNDEGKSQGQAKTEDMS